jgi:hypothetical protein
MFGWIARATNWAFGTIGGTVVGWVHDLINGLYGFLHTIFGDVIGGWNAFFGACRLWADQIGAFATEVMNGFIHLWHVWWPDLYRFIIHDIVDPLTKAIAWIAREGSTLWYYITHPPELVALIYEDIILRIEKLAWATAEKLGTFFLALIIKNLKTLLTVVEDIIDAVF